ncbi:MAG TPA: hypothetical protein VIL37_08470 [Natronosporangium sp.]
MHYRWPHRVAAPAALDKALADVFGEPALRTRKLELEIDQEYWEMICHDQWAGNIYRYSF